MNDIRGKCVTFGERRITAPHDILRTHLYTNLLDGLDENTHITIGDKTLKLSLTDTYGSHIQLRRQDDGFMCRHKVYLEYEIKMEDN